MSYISQHMALEIWLACKRRRLPVTIPLFHCNSQNSIIKFFSTPHSTDYWLLEMKTLMIIKFLIKSALRLQVG